MRITVKLFTELRRYAPNDHGSFELDLPPESSVDMILDRLGVPPDLDLVISIGGELADRQTRLADGDTVVIFTPAEGG